MSKTRDITQGYIFSKLRIMAMKQQTLNRQLLPVNKNKSLSKEIYRAQHTKTPATCSFLSKTCCKLTIALNLQARKSIKEDKLETEGPLSEKDEVKKAEQNTMEQQKKVEKKQPKKDGK